MSARSEAHLVAVMEKQKGDAHFRAIRFEEAAFHYTKAIALSSKSPNFLAHSLCNRALAMLRLHEYGRTVEDCTAAIQLNAGNVTAYIARAFGRFYLGSFESALRDYDVASRLSPDNPTLQAKLRRAADALSSCNRQPQQQLEWIGDFGLLELDSASSSNSNSSKAAARRHRTQAVPLQPAPLVQECPPLIATGESVGSTCEAMLNYTKYRLNDKAVSAKAHGNRMFSVGDYRAAAELYTRSIKLNPMDAIFYSNRAQVYLKLGRYCEAVTDCSVSISLRPTIKAYARRAASYSALARSAPAARMVGHLEAAWADYARALAFEPRNPEILELMTDCLLQLKKHKNKLSKEKTRMIENSLKDGKLEAEMSLHPTEMSLAQHALETGNRMIARGLCTQAVDVFLVGLESQPNDRDLIVALSKLRERLIAQEKKQSK